MPHGSFRGGGGGAAAAPDAGQPRSSIASTTANAVSTGGERSLPPGRTIEYLTFLPGAAVPHGRLYGWVELLLNGEVVGVLGGVYLTASAANRPTSPSLPVSLPVLAGMSFRCRVAAATQGGGIAVDCLATLSTQPPQYAQPYFEAPGSGPGDMRRVATANPAAGADPADQTVPNNVLWRVLGVHGTLVADANAANRMPTVVLRDSGSQVVTQGGATVAATAGTTTVFRSAIGNSGGGVAGAQVCFGIPNHQLPAGSVVSPFSTIGLQVGDDWGVCVLGIEEWAVP